MFYKILMNKKMKSNFVFINGYKIIIINYYKYYFFTFFEIEIRIHFF